MAEPVGIVGVRFLNAKPLLAGLEAGIHAAFPYRFSVADPSACAGDLAEGTVDAGLVPVASLPALPAAAALPGLGVASRQAATSVLLVSRVPLREVRTLAAHTASRTSVILARLLLLEQWGARPEVVPATPPLAAMLSGADAAVIIGDPALSERGRSGLLEIDLAAAWVEWTGLPFVFAIWAVRGGSPAGLEELFMRSLDHAVGHWEELIPRWSAAHHLDLEATRHYLGSILTYHLGDAERAGIEEFLRLTARAGLLPGRREIWRTA
ncbi:MAG: menaquinone biosynthetic enzyme MqnA/MqnD family protein [Acidobacteriota bacterium]